MNEDEIIKYHEKKPSGKIGIEKTKKLGKEEVNIAYTPGVNVISEKISEDKERVYDYTWKGNTIAIITDGTAILGSGNLGPDAAIPVLEGKSMLLKRLGKVNAVPIVVDESDVDKIVDHMKSISSSFGGIMIEDVSAPRCFELERKLKQELDIPVFHDDQHGTSVVVLAALINACEVLDRNIRKLDIVISGAGAAGNATAKLLVKYLHQHEGDIIICDSKGILYEGRENMDKYKQELAEITNRANMRGSLEHAMEDSDVFIGLSKGGLLTKDMISKMNDGPIIFALANPDPEIDPGKAKEAGASIIATGRSDYENQINNALCFPGLTRGILDSRTDNINRDVYIEVAETLASAIEPSKNNLLPKLLGSNYSNKVARSVEEKLSK